VRYFSNVSKEVATQNQTEFNWIKTEDDMPERPTN
jgi:hypothetical protein